MSEHIYNEQIQIILCIFNAYLVLIMGTYLKNFFSESAKNTKIIFIFYFYANTTFSFDRQ